MDEPRSHVVSVNGHSMHYVQAGQGPVVVLLHGVLGTHRSWVRLIDDISESHTVIAPDLFGHGESARTHGDYSLGGHAAALRDFFEALALESVTLVGHSLGGGVSMQFVYLFPGRVERLVLVSSGGLGREVHPVLRAPAMPGAELVLPVLASKFVRGRAEAAGRMLSKVGIRGGHDIAEAWEGFSSLGDAETRRAFLSTIRSVVDTGGQSVTAYDRLEQVAEVPVLLVWGSNDKLIPAWHAAAAAQRLPQARIEVFEGAGHFPHMEDPERFTRVLLKFIADTPLGKQRRTARSRRGATSAEEGRQAARAARRAKVAVLPVGAPDDGAPAPAGAPPADAPPAEAG